MTVLSSRYQDRLGLGASLGKSKETVTPVTKRKIATKLVLFKLKNHVSVFEAFEAFERYITRQTG